MKEETNTELKAVIPAIPLKAVLKVIASVDTNAVLKVTPDGISVLMSDCVNASMIDLTLDRSAFLKYDAVGYSEIEIDVDRLRKMLVVADDLNMVSLERSADEKNLIISFGYFRYELPLLKDLRTPKTHMPTLSWLATVKIPGHRFKRLVKAAEVVSDHAYVGVDADGTFFMKAEGDHIGGDELSRVSMDMPMMIPMSEKVVSCYSLDYLHALAKVVPEDGTVGLCIATDLPLLVEYKCCDGGRVKYMITPRIEID